MKPTTFKSYLRRFLPHLAVESYRPMVAVCAAALAQPLDDTDRELLVRLLGGRDVPAAPVSELVVIAGRASGKTEMMAALCGYLALCRRWRVQPGQVPVGLMLCPTLDQASIAFTFLVGQLQSNATLAAEIATVTRDRVEFCNGVCVEVTAANRSTVRGYSSPFAICDELAHWPTNADAASPDVEVLAALIPALARFSDSLLVAISTPYGQLGALWDFYTRCWGRNDARTLVAGGGTADFNATFSQAKIDEALRVDPERNTSEYLPLQFRAGVAGFIPAELIDRSTRGSPLAMVRVKHLSSGAVPVYVAGLDTAGEGADSPAVAVVHGDGDRIVVDVARRFPSKMPTDEVARQMRVLLADYGLSGGACDGYAAGIARRFYAAHGVELRDAANNTSDTYLRFYPLLSSGRVELPPDPVLRAELLGLAREPGRSGRDYVRHRRNCHDDLACAVARAVVACADAQPAEGVLPMGIESDLFGDYVDEHGGSIDRIRWNAPY